MKESLSAERTTRWVVYLCWIAPLLLASLARPAAAQTSDTRKWEVEFHGGGMLVSNPADGTVNVPGPAEPFTTGLGVTGLPSRRVSSWYFGDGAALINQVSGGPVFNRPLRITPLDPVLSGLLAERRNGGSFGVRVSRVLSPRLSAEFSLDYSLAQLEITDGALLGIEASRASFLAMWYELQTTGPFLQPRVTSTTDIQDGLARQVVSTGVLNINLKTTGMLIPHVTAGGGVISRVGDASSATLSGSYQFLWANAFPFNESDTVSVRDSRPDHAFVGVFGGGVRVHASPRWGVRFDVREHVSGNKVSTLADANPSTALATPATFFFSTTTPSIQFSTQASPRSSLSGPRLEGVETFKGSGIQRHTSITTGVFWRF